MAKLNKHYKKKKSPHIVSFSLKKNRTSGTHAPDVIIGDIHHANQLGVAGLQGPTPYEDAATMTSIIRPGMLNWIEEYRAAQQNPTRAYNMGDTRYNYDTGGVETFDGVVWIDLTNANPYIAGTPLNLDV